MVSINPTVYLGVRDNANRRTVLLDLVQVGLDRLLAVLVLPLLGVLGERLLLGLVPVDDFIRKNPLSN